MVVVTLHAESLLLLSSITLHLLANLDVDVEELGDTAVEADGLALVQVTLAVVDGDTLLGARLGQAMIRDGNKLEWVRDMDNSKMDWIGMRVLQSSGF